MSRIYKKQIKKVNGKMVQQNILGNHGQKSLSNSQEIPHPCFAERHSAIGRIPGDEWMK